MRELSANDANNTQWQTDVVISLDYLASVGDDPHGRGGEALVILRRLKSQGRLTPAQEGWIGTVESALAGLPPPDRTPSPAVEQIQGTYVGTNTQTPAGTATMSEVPGEYKITLSFQQSGANVTATYLTLQGGRGRGTGTITGNAINAISFRSEIVNCPGSLTASLMFSDDIVSWTYTGQDCGGPVRGYGAAKKTRP